MKVNEAYESILFNQVNLRTVTAEEKAIKVNNKATDATMTGNYVMIDRLDDKYFINGNRFYFADPESDVKVKGFRATVEIKEPQVSDINTLYIKVDGQVTAVDKVLMDDFIGGKVYNINGQFVRSDLKTAE